MFDRIRSALRGIDGTVNDRGQAATSGVVRVVVGVIMIAFTYPIALDALTSVNTTDWDSQVVNVWDAMPVLTVLTGLMIVISYVRRFTS